MSSWTYVCGCVYYDYFPLDLLEETLIEDEELLNKSIHEHIERSLQDIFDKTDVPCGREGGIEYSINVNSIRFGVNFIGSLRDFEEEDTKSIVEWFKKITLDIKKYDKNFSVRQAILEINCSSVDYFLILLFERVFRLDNSHVIRRKRIPKLKGEFD